MIPVKQTRKGGADAPWQERGDCFDAGLASILEVDIEDARVSQNPDEDWWENAQAAARAHGRTLLQVYNRSTTEAQLSAADLGCYVGDVYWLASVPSLNLGADSAGNQVRHVVVMRGPELAHDPSTGERTYPAGAALDDVPVHVAIVLLELASAGRKLVAAPSTKRHVACPECGYATTVIDGPDDLPWCLHANSMITWRRVGGSHRMVEAEVRT